MRKSNEKGIKSKRNKTRLMITEIQFLNDCVKDFSWLILVIIYTWKSPHSLTPIFISLKINSQNVKMDSGSHPQIVLSQDLNQLQHGEIISVDKQCLLGGGLKWGLTSVCSLDAVMLQPSQLPTFDMVLKTDILLLTRINTWCIERLGENGRFTDTLSILC